MTEIIPLVDLKRQHQYLWEPILEKLTRVIEDNAVIGGEYVDTFEQKFAQYCGSRHCVGVANGTDALILAPQSLDIGTGDEVTTTACSFFATAEAISSVGAKPVFCDID